MNNAVGFKKILLMFAIAFCFTSSGAFASDNVLQAIQVNGVNDTYSIILKSDDVAEIKKTVQAPNKMVINLKGIRASKTINTIYNNTSSVDSVVVEPTGDDSVKILVQANNVANAEIQFDSLKTPLGVLGNSQNQSKPSGEIILNNPMESYKPVYDSSADQEDSDFSLASTAAPVARHLKNAIKNDKLSWMITFGLFGLLLMSGMKMIKGKDNEIKVGLSQSLRDREIDLYRGLGVSAELNRPVLNQNEVTMPQNATGINYGLRAYQNDTRSPYVSPETLRQRPATVQTAPVNPSVNTSLNSQPAMKSTVARSQGNMQATAQTKIQMPQANATNTMSRAIQSATAPKKPANIDSMKFLESMTKIYEKNGRADLAQGLKANMKKAKVNLV